MLRTVLVAASIAMALTQAAAAQTPAPAPAAPAAPAAAAPVSDQDLKAYARVLLDIEKLRATPGALTQPAMAEAVQKAGLDPAKFNDMTKRMSADSAFNQSVQAAVRELQAATPAAAPATGG
jgi:hypothetical protein